MATGICCKEDDFCFSAGVYDPVYANKEWKITLSAYLTRILGEKSALVAILTNRNSGKIEQATISRDCYLCFNKSSQKNVFAHNVNDMDLIHVRVTVNK